MRGTRYEKMRRNFLDRVANRSNLDPDLIYYGLEVTRVSSLSLSLVLYSIASFLYTRTTNFESRAVSRKKGGINADISVFEILEI